MVAPLLFSGTHSRNFSRGDAIMKFSYYLRTAALALLTLASAAFAQDRGTPAEAKAMLEQAVADVNAVGAEKAFADFTDSNNSKWHHKDLYVFVVKFDGMTVAHGANKALVGRNLIEVKDPDGKLFIKAMIDEVKAKGSGAVDYSFTDPTTKKISAKTSYVARVPGYDEVIGVGVYKR
jgi:cytochrome c